MRDSLRLTGSICAAVLALGCGTSAAGNAEDVNALVTRGAQQLQMAHSDPLHRLQHESAAIDDLQAAVRLAPDNYYARHNLGEAAFQTGRYDRAAAEFSAAIRINGRAARSYLGRGNAFLELNRKDDAARDYEQAMRLDPSLRPIVSQQAASVREHVRLREQAAAEAAYAASHPRRASPPSPYDDPAMKRIENIKRWYEYHPNAAPWDNPYR